MTQTKKHVKTWLPWLLIIISLVLSYEFLNSGKVKRKKQQQQSTQKMRIVKVSQLHRSTVNPLWFATGIVMPSEQVTISAQVSGIVESINSKVLPGAVLEKGQPLLSLEKTDLLLSLQSAQSQLIQAESNYQLELGERQLAKEEIKYINDAEKETLEMSLVLREPQFQSVKARLEIAKINVKKAEVALARTQVTMPFNGQIMDKRVGVGSKVGTNTQLFQVVNIEQFWLEVKIPRSFLSILDVDKPVTLSQENLWGKGITRQASIFSVLPELDKRDRQARLLLLIDDPQSVKNNSQPAVYINDFLNVSLTAKPIENVWTIRSNWLQQDGSIWVVDKQRTLQKRMVEVRFKGRDYIYVDGAFEQGDVAVAEKISVAAVGMPVKVKQLDIPVVSKDVASKKTNKKANRKGKGSKLTKAEREKRQAQRKALQNKDTAQPTTAAQGKG